MQELSSELLLFEIEEILRTMPPSESLGNYSSDILAWLGRASAAINAWDKFKATSFDIGIGRLSSSNARDYGTATRGILVMLHQAHNDLRMKTVGPLSVSINKGAVFDYFDELRKVIELARKDLFFVDPYLDAEFVSRYLPHVARGTTIRLLGREKTPALISAVKLISQQNNLTISVHSSPNLHDRYLFVDETACYQSGASFKDGAKKAGTTLTQITDAFTAMLSTYEQSWTQGTSHI